MNPRRNKDRYQNRSFKELKEIAKNLEPILRLGKKGLNDNVIQEIDTQLKKRTMIKIKFLQSFMDMYNRRTIGDEIAKRTKSEIILQVGGVLVLFRK